MTKKEIHALFAAYGVVKRIRAPKKFGGDHRGFAFVDFSTAQEARTAKEALSSTHLYGRRLVLDWAKEDDVNEATGGTSGLVLENLRKRALQDSKLITQDRGKKARNVNDVLEGTEGGEGREGGEGKMEMDDMDDDDDDDE